MTEQATLEKIKSQVTENPVVIYMKGSPQFPMCGFSSRAAQALADTGLPFSFVNVMDDPQIFEHLPKYADWPTFPHIFSGGEVIGGCEIVLELAERNDLKQMMNEAIENQKA